jgi:hypothetical protein
MMAHTYNPGYSEVREREDLGLRLAWTKKFTRLHLNQWLGLVAHACHPQLHSKAKIDLWSRPAQA